MTFCKNPPIVDWTDGASENASFTLTTSNIEEENFDGSSGCTYSFLMTCNTSIVFLLVFLVLKKLHLFIGSLKQHDLLFNTTFFGCFGFLVWW
jgi:hypothetical protein